MSDFRVQAYRLLNDLIRAPEAELPGLLRQSLTPDACWDVSFPIGRLLGAEAVLEGLLLPLRRALSHPIRRDEIFIGGANRRSTGGEWVASVTHYVGNNSGEFAGLRPCDRLVFLRSGEFYRIKGGRIAEAKIILDLLDLSRQSGRFPLEHMLGTEMLFPAPATHDGVLPHDEGRGSVTLDLVEAMLADLQGYDPRTMDSPGQVGRNGYWHEEMLWYGPGGIGASYRWQGFVKDHRRAFLHAFPDRRGGNHYCRIGDGNYAAVSGWPSMTMTHAGDYLGVPATGRALTLRVMDFYRCAGGRIMENWVCLDYLDLFDQMGVDLIARSRGMKSTD